LAYNVLGVSKFILSYIWKNNFELYSWDFRLVVWV
jgi:hypothetical protein